MTNEQAQVQSKEAQPERATPILEPAKSITKTEAIFFRILVHEFEGFCIISMGDIVVKCNSTKEEAQQHTLSFYKMIIKEELTDITKENQDEKETIN